MDNYTSRVAAAVTAYMTRNGLTQRALGARLGWSTTKVNQRISGARKWTLVDLDDLEAVGVLRIEVIAV